MGEAIKCCPVSGALEYGRADARACRCDDANDIHAPAYVDLASADATRGCLAPVVVRSLVVADPAFSMHPLWLRLPAGRQSLVRSAIPCATRPAAV